MLLFFCNVIDRWNYIVVCSEFFFFFFKEDSFVFGVLCPAGNGKVSSCAAAEGSFTALTGLLEVEPLHFSCISTSDGTRVERDDASMFTGNLHFCLNVLVCSLWILHCLNDYCSIAVSSFGVTPAVGSLPAGPFGEASTALSSAAQVALQSLSHAMVSAEQQLQVLQEKQQQLLKLQQQVKNQLTIMRATIFTQNLEH